MATCAITVFGGNSDGNNPIFLEAAKGLGECLVARDCVVICGGKASGLIGAMGSAALAKGGKVKAVIPTIFRDHVSVGDVVCVDSLATRKERLISECDALIVLPGGNGTMDEFFEVLLGNQLKLYQKPLGILNTAGYYGHLLEQIDQMIGAGFAGPEVRDLFVVSDDYASLVDTIVGMVGKRRGAGAL